METIINHSLEVIASIATHINASPTSTLLIGLWLIFPTLQDLRTIVINIVSSHIYAKLSSPVTEKQELNNSQESELIKTDATPIEKVSGVEQTQYRCSISILSKSILKLETTSKKSVRLD